MPEAGTVSLPVQPYQVNHFYRLLNIPDLFSLNLNPNVAIRAEAGIN